jgi:hypothetical protein
VADLLVELVDVSATVLDLATRTLARCLGYETTYENRLQRIVSWRSGDGAIMVTFLDSNIVNLATPAAAFNKSLLVRLNRELDIDCDLESFANRSIWNAASSRAEMHLENQAVSFSGADWQVHFVAGESTWTESSYKYEVDGISVLGAQVGFDCRTQWVHHRARVVVTAFDAA